MKIKAHDRYNAAATLEVLEVCGVFRGFFLPKRCLNLNGQIN